MWQIPVTTLKLLVNKCTFVNIGHRLIFIYDGKRYQNSILDFISLIILAVSTDTSVFFHRSSRWMSPRGRILKWRPKSWRRKSRLCRLKSTRKVWWRLLQGLKPRAMQPQPFLASRRSARNRAALRTRSSPDPGCPLQRNNQRHPHTLRIKFMKSTKFWNKNCEWILLELNIRKFFSFNLFKSETQNSWLQLFVVRFGSIYLVLF